MADTEFKSRSITFPEGWKRHSNGGVIDGAKYRPDLSFVDQEGNVVCVIESSSTNDRKVGVGELCLADKFFSDNKIDGVLIFSLCGKSQYPPRPDTQASYLKPYFRHLKRGSMPNGVRVVYFIDENEFADLGWAALSEAFEEKAHVLEA
jgi:hypothetical protein